MVAVSGAWAPATATHACRTRRRRAAERPAPTCTLAFPQWIHILTGICGRRTASYGKNIRAHGTGRMVLANEWLGPAGLLGPTVANHESSAANSHTRVLCKRAFNHILVMPKY